VTGSHFELLRKALKHAPLRLLVELPDGIGEVTWLIECRHADADVDHEFFIHWSGRHEEPPPSLNPDGELHGPPAGGKEITVLPDTNATVGSVVLEHQIVCARGRAKVVISGLGVPVGKAGKTHVSERNELAMVNLRIEFAGLEFLGELDRDSIGLVALGRLCLALSEEEDRDLERLGQLLGGNQPGAAIMRDERHVFLPTWMSALLEQREQPGPNALEVRRGRNVDMVVINDALLWELDRKEIGPENPRFARRPETGSGGPLGVMFDRLERLV